jgi:hypothetical protein
MLVRVCKICGKEFAVRYHSSTRKACGDECSKVLHARGIRKHGDSNTRLHNIWCGMKSRCNGTGGQNARTYYAERGITCCAEWESSFQAFKDWAIANGYSEKLELDRINNDLGYTPSNCRWATRSEQMRNTRKRKNALSKYRGVSLIAPTGKWRATGCKAGSITHLGVFTE